MYEVRILLRGLMRPLAIGGELLGEESADFPRSRWGTGGRILEGEVVGIAGREAVAESDVALGGGEG